MRHNQRPRLCRSRWRLRGLRSNSPQPSGKNELITKYSAGSFLCKTGLFLIAKIIFETRQPSLYYKVRVQGARSHELSAGRDRHHLTSNLGWLSVPDRLACSLTAE